MPGDEVEKVRKWLRDGGLPLELRARDAFRAAGADITSHGDYYVDATTEQTREADVIATFAPRIDRSSHAGLGYVDVTYVVECKRPREPTQSVWVLYRDSSVNHLKGAGGSPHLDLVATYNWRASHPRGLEVLDGVELAKHLDSRIQPAYQLVDTERSQQTYSALSQAVSATDGLARTAGAPKVTFPVIGIHVWIPVVLTSAPICIVDVDAVGAEGTGYPVSTVTTPQLLTARYGDLGRVRSAWVVPQEAINDFAADAYNGARALHIS